MRTKVLIVDNDTETTDLLKIVLDPDSFEVYAANTGEEGLAFTRQIEPDIIILDLSMPGIGGWQMCKEIRSFSPVPILVLSAVSKPGLVAQALDWGADDYLLKPIPRSVLIAHIKRLIRRARAEREGQQSGFGYAF